MDKNTIYIVGDPGADAQTGAMLAELQRLSEQTGREIICVADESEIPGDALEKIEAERPDFEKMLEALDESFNTQDLHGFPEISEEFVLSPSTPAPAFLPGWSLPQPGPMSPLTPKEKRRAKAKRKAARKARRKNR